MAQENSTAPTAGGARSQTYIFETETKLWEIEGQSDEGRELQSLSTGSKKIQFLKENGKETTKESSERIMLHQPGAWRFCNVGQLEYMFRADDDTGSESELERQCKEIEGNEQKKEFFVRNATRIREWPERIHRVENLD